LKKLLFVGIAVLVAVPATAALGETDRDRVTGGGQVLVSSDGGVGDTIAFTAQALVSGEEAARGEVQYVNREGGTGQGQEVLHGRVTCVTAEGTMAKIAGTWNNDAGDFEILVVDNGEGALADDDIVTVQPEETSPQCDEDDDDDDGETALARGNAQVHDGD
jgi:hypothetical protein